MKRKFAAPHRVDRCPIWPVLLCAGLSLLPIARAMADDRVPNPLAPAAPAAAPAATPSSAAAVDLEMAGNFTVLGASEAGKTLFIKFSAAPTLESALGQAADALGKIMDARPVLAGGFADAKSNTQGGALLSGKIKGQPMRGWIFCGLEVPPPLNGNRLDITAPGAGGVRGASVTIVLATSTASREELAHLFGYLPATLKMTSHNFPDGSGSIDLPERWTTSNDTAAFGIVVNGPEGQCVIFNLFAQINTPDCRLVQLARKNYAMALQMYHNQERIYQQQLEFHRQHPNVLVMPAPKAPPEPDANPNVQFHGLTFCPMCSGAEEVVKNLFPINEANQKRDGKGYSAVEKVLQISPGAPNPLMPGSASGLVYMVVSDHNGDKVQTMRVLRWISTCPIEKGEAWQLGTTLMRAPDATFDRELPVMNAVLNSVKLDMNVVSKRMAERGEQVRQAIADNTRIMLERHHEFQKLQADRFNHFESQIAAQQKAMHDSTSDFIEYISGVRRVMDSETGKPVDVELSNADHIVEEMNKNSNDPTRFKQMPLRNDR